MVPQHGEEGKTRDSTKAEEEKVRNVIVYTHGPRIRLRTLGVGDECGKGNGEICDTRITSKERGGGQGRY